MAPNLGGQSGSWTRYYEVARDSNRLLRTWQGDQDWNSNTATEKAEYRHDPHGSMLNLGNATASFDMRWDWNDMIHTIDLGGGGRAWYQYGAEKQRTRKRIERNFGVEERIYLGGFDLYRRWVGGNLVEEIESLHLFESEQRVLLVDDVLVAQSTAQPGPNGLRVKEQTLFRYQYGNHLGSVGSELDGAARVISYEEFHPYGTSAYRLMDSAVEAPPKRYRYTGMERDEESGLSYHGARYSSGALGRWCSTEPLGLLGGTNQFAFVENNPVKIVDLDGRLGTIALGLIGAAVGFVGGAGYGLYKGESIETSVKYGAAGAIVLGAAGLTLGASISATGSVGAGLTAWGTKAIVGAGISSTRQTLEIKAGKRKEISVPEMAVSAALATVPLPARIAAPVAGLGGSVMLVQGAKEIGNTGGNEYEKALGVFDATVGMFSYAAPLLSMGSGGGPMIPALSTITGVVSSAAVPTKTSSVGSIGAAAALNTFMASAEKEKPKAEHRAEWEEHFKKFGGEEAVTKLPPRGKLHEHHLLPKELKEQFEKFLLNIEGFKIWLQGEVHLTHFHGGAKGGGLWNETWKAFFLDPKNVKATQADVLKQLEMMKIQWDVESHSLGKAAP